jgi:hypothetical protein
MTVVLEILIGIGVVCLFLYYVLKRLFIDIDDIDLDVV